MSLLVDGWTKWQGLDMAMTLMRLEATTIATIARQKLRTKLDQPPHGLIEGTSIFPTFGGNMWQTLDVTII
jgi:hypothetical protein